MLNNYKKIQWNQIKIRIMRDNNNNNYIQIKNKKMNNKVIY